MIELRNKENSALIANITEEQMAFLQNMLEEESEQDTDYWVNAVTLEYFREHECDPQLLQILQGAIGEGEGIEIEWVTV